MHALVQGLAFLLCCFPVCLYSQEDLPEREENSHTGSENSAIKIERLAPVHVQAQTSKNPDSLTEVNLEHYTGFAKVIEREQFEGRMTTVPDLLRHSSGVQVKQLGGMGSDAHLSLRGSKSKQLNVFLDGLLMNSPFYGEAQFQSLPTSLIGSLEIYPDFTPLVLSHANLAGALNIKSRQFSAGEKGGELGLSSGSFNTKALELSAWGAFHEWQTILGASHISADNDFPVDEDIFRSTYAERQNDAYKADYGFVKLGKQFSSVNVQVMGQTHGHRKEVATIKNWQSDAAYIDSETARLQAMIDYASGLWKLSHRFFYAAEDNLFNDEQGSIGLGKDKLESFQKSVGVFSIADILFEKNQLMFSVDFHLASMEQEDKIKQKDTLDSERSTIIFGISDDLHVNKLWLIHANSRFYLVDENMSFLTGEKESVDGRFNSQSWQLGSQFHLSDKLMLKANIGKNIRIPYLFEKYGSAGSFQGNPELSPEKAHVVDAGFLFENKYNLVGANVFYRNIDDGIYHVFDSRGVAHPMNIGKSELIGFEAQWQLMFSAWMSLNTAINVMDSVNNSTIKAHQQQKMPGVFHQSASVGTLLHWKKWRFNNSLTVFDDLYYDLANSVAADRQTQLSSTLTFVLPEFSFDLRVNNILDKNYMGFNRMPTPGRSVMASVHFKI